MSLPVDFNTRTISALEKKSICFRIKAEKTFKFIWSKIMDSPLPSPGSH
jgi:hypothetical protein